MVLAGLSAAPEPRAESWGPRAAGAGGAALGDLPQFHTSPGEEGAQTAVSRGGSEPPSPRRGAAGGRQLSRCVGDLSRRSLGAVPRRRPRPIGRRAAGRAGTNTAASCTNTLRNRVPGSRLLAGRDGFWHDWA